MSEVKTKILAKTMRLKSSVLDRSQCEYWQVQNHTLFPSGASVPRPHSDFHGKSMNEWR